MFIASSPDLKGVFSERVELQRLWIDFIYEMLTISP